MQIRIIAILTILILFDASNPVYSQMAPVNRENYRLHMNATSSSINIDGILDEQAWLNAEKTGLFHKVTPVDEGYPISQSEVIMAYDEDNFYIGITCYDTVPGKRPVESLRRDFNFGKNDNFLIFIDTYNDQTNGFSFGISAAGAQWDGIQADGGFVSLNWDTKWKSAVQNYPDKWVAEMAIPFRSIRYKDGDTQWGINFSRLDLKTGEKSSWAPVPRQFQTANLAFTGTLEWDQPLPQRGARYSLIPYVFGKSTKDFESENEARYDTKVGFDAKITLSTSLNLDLTVNPDFSQVEVDQQRTNLDRFELFFPERRQFFLENSDLFASLGEDGNRPFFSRRIGLTNPVKGGIRLSGKIGKNSRIGLMNMQTGTEGDIAAANFSVGVLQQQIFGRSNISLFMVNKEVTGNQDESNTNYNRIIGVDFNLSSADNRWTGKVFYHQSLYQDKSGNAFSTSGKVVYETTKITAGLQSSYIGEGYNADVGFIRRTGVFNIQPKFSYRIFPKSKAIVRHSFDVTFDLFFDQKTKLRDRLIDVSYWLTWQDRSVMKLSINETFIKLLRPFDPTNSRGELLPIDSEHQWNEISLAYDSGSKNLFTYVVEAGYGGFYNGNRFFIQSDVGYRVQPFGNLGIVTTFDKIDLPTPFNSGNFLLFGPKLDLTFTDNLFLTTFIQYNNQIDNVNVNARLQWRFAPGSDFFIVYTQNSFPGKFDTKNRGLVAKLAYWFN